MKVIAWDNLPAQLSWKERVAFLAYKGHSIEQVDTPVEEHFEPGLYIRTMRIPAGTLFLGREHLVGHRLELVSGSAILFTPTGRIQYTGPAEIYTAPGFHAVAQILSDVVCRTYHANPDESRDSTLCEARAFAPKEDMLKLGRAVEARLTYQQMISDPKIKAIEEQTRPLFSRTDDLLHVILPLYVGTSETDGFGVFASERLPKGVEIGAVRWEGRRTIVGRYTNHSNSPNIVFVHRGQNLYAIALEDIPVDTELYVDYTAAVRTNKESLCLEQ